MYFIEFSISKNVKKNIHIYIYVNKNKKTIKFIAFIVNKNMLCYGMVHNTVCECP